MSKLVYVAIISAFVNNVILSQNMGVDSMKEVSKNIMGSIRMSCGVMFITVVSSVITWPIGHYILHKFDFSFLSTIVFVLVVAAVTKIVDIYIQKRIPNVKKEYKNLLPMILINSAVLGIVLTNVDVGYSFLRSLVNSFFGALGFSVTVIIMAGIRDKIKYNDVPRPFEGMPILLVTAGLMAIAFYGFSSLI